MKQTITFFVTGIVASLPFIFNSESDAIEYKQPSYKVQSTKTTTELIERTDLYRKMITLEYRADSLHKEVEKLKNEKITERPIEIAEW